MAYVYDAERLARKDVIRAEMEKAREPAAIWGFCAIILNIVYVTGFYWVSLDLSTLEEKSQFYWINSLELFDPIVIAAAALWVVVMLAWAIYSLLYSGLKGELNNM